MTFNLILIGDNSHFSTVWHAVTFPADYNNENISICNLEQMPFNKWIAYHFTEPLLLLFMYGFSHESYTRTQRCI